MIVGYIHVCQKGDWVRSLRMLTDAIRSSELYENTHIIRIGIVNDEGKIVDNDILNDDKFKIYYFGKSSNYERPTLLHMRTKTIDDPEDTMYYYLHTKGIKHFGTINEQCIVDWINLMLYWNIEKWRIAVSILNTHDTYGCNDVGHHYSGNFWWTKKSHIMSLPIYIGDNYTDPETWIQIVRDNKFCIYNSGYQGNGHYYTPFPRELYCKK
jgi:hypothetical protein